MDTIKVFLNADPNWRWNSSSPIKSGKHLVTSTNGFNDEYFNHSAGTINLAWDVNDSLTLKYIGGYTDYLYTRITDDDR